MISGFRSDLYSKENTKAKVINPEVIKSPEPAQFSDLPVQTQVNPGNELAHSTCDAFKQGNG